jgi:uncharacterized protein (TIGR03437 family)
MLAMTASGLMAAPKLRLSTTTVGPLLIAAGQNGTTQIVDAANFGDGTLSLTATANVPWLAATVGGPRACTLRSTCIAVQIALNTSALTRGRYTGIVTLSDPNAIDAPQNITVTVSIGGIPDSFDLFLPPGGSTTAPFVSGRLTTVVTNPVGGPRLSIVGSGGGSFDFALSYQVSVTAPAGTPDGDYTGRIAVVGSSFAQDVKSVPVIAHVTSQPIAALSSSSVLFRLAQGGPKADQAVVLNNAGLGTLTVAGTTVNPPAPWLTAKISGNVIIFTADPTGLSPGAFRTTVTIQSNARNGPTTLPVELNVLAAGPPVSYFQGVLDNALFLAEGALAPGGIVAVFGERLSSSAPVQATTLPLGTTLGGVSVFVNNIAVPVYYVSANQINFQIPYDTPAGEALFRVDRDGQRGNTVTATILPVVPTILRLGIDNYGIIVLNDPVLTFAIRPTNGISSRPAKAGVDVVTIYSLGLGQTTPPVTAGVAAPVEPLARVPGVKVIFGEYLIPGSAPLIEPLYAGLTPGSVGLYQINVLVPQSSPRGDQVTVFLTIGLLASNRVTLAVE